jgi:succinate dehydrogenase / fumarate reductase cytochrome b subunit
MNRPFISLCQQELGKMKWVETSGKPTRAMTQPTATRQRPLSPHLSIYRPKITMTMSIIHRITGGALYFGTLLLAAWLIAAAIGEDAFNMVSWVYSSWIGYLVLFGYTWALLHHLAGGVRHFIWDMGAGLEKHTASKIAWLTLAFSLPATILVWVVAFAVR